MQSSLGCHFYLKLLEFHQCPKHTARPYRRARQDRHGGRHSGCAVSPPACGAAPICPRASGQGKLGSPSYVLVHTHLRPVIAAPPAPPRSGHTGLAARDPARQRLPRGACSTAPNSAPRLHRPRRHPRAAAYHFVDCKQLVAQCPRRHTPLRVHKKKPPPEGSGLSGD